MLLMTPMPSPEQLKAVSASWHGAPLPNNPKPVRETRAAAGRGSANGWAQESVG